MGVSFVKITVKGKDYIYYRPYVRKNGDQKGKHQSFPFVRQHRRAWSCSLV